MLKDILITKQKLAEMVYAATLGGVALWFRDYPFQIQAIVDWLQFGLIFVLFVVAVGDEKRHKNHQERESKSVGQFLNCWTKLWFVWLVLYLLFAIDNSYKAVLADTSESVKLNANEINDWEKFSASLLDESNKVSKFIIQKLGTNNPAVLSARAIRQAGYATAVQQNSILDALNTNVIKEGSIYDSELFYGGDIPSLKARFLKPPLDPAKVEHLNLLLLKRSFSHTIVNNNPLTSKLWETVINWIANVANNLQSFFIFLLFLIMTRETTNSHKVLIDRVTTLGFSVITLLAIFELVAVVVPSSQNATNESRLLSDVLRNVGILLSIVSGLSAGVAFCLFVGRLGSVYLGLNPLYIAALYAYATIQLLYPLFRMFDYYSPHSQEFVQTSQIVLKITAAILKLVLFLRVRECYRSPRLLFFMKKAAENLRTVPTEYESFEASDLKSL